MRTKTNGKWRQKGRAWPGGDALGFTETQGMEPCISVVGGKVNQRRLPGEGDLAGTLKDSPVYTEDEGASRGKGL